MWDFQLQMKKVIGIDLGEARVGIAISDDLGMLAHPLETISARSQNHIERILEIITTKNIETVIVGMPRNMDGSYGAAATKSREFIEALKARISIQVLPWDERLSTVSAQRSLHEAGRNSKKQRPVIDQVAAQIILQSWLDSVA